jgi:hypothetical protein
VDGFVCNIVAPVLGGHAALRPPETGPQTSLRIRAVIGV